jgi:ABC-type branched-subunit amino acid transport system substrate-binding protein
VHGEISLAEVESIIEAGIEARGGSIPTDDIADTIDALADMGIETDNGLTEAQKDAEFLRSMRERGKDSPITPHLSFDAMASLARAIKREKNALPDPRKASEEAAATREILSKRTWIQNVFAHLGPRIRNERRVRDWPAAGATAPARIRWRPARRAGP